MTLAVDEIIDRRALKRRISFWRIAALILAVLAVIGIAGALGLFENLGKKSSAHIASVNITGVITNDKPMLKLIKNLEEDENVKAVILNISSPGGSTVGGEAIYEAVRSLSNEKPVATSVGTLAASAGYMIASASDHIVARRSSIVGSIGVIFQYADASKLLDKVGLEINEIKSAPLKAEPSPFHPASEEAKAMIDRLIKDSFNWFVGIVAERRDMEKPKVLALADGSIFTGSQGVKNGLVDAIGDQETVRKWFVKEKEISDDLKIVEWTPVRKQNNGFGANSDLGNAIGWILGKLGFPNDATRFEPIKEALPDRLFLDGLISMMQNK